MKPMKPMRPERPPRRRQRAAGPATPRPEWTRESAVLRIAGRWPRLDDITPEWAWGGSTGRGVRVAIIDSGIEADHPDLGRLRRPRRQRGGGPQRRGRARGHRRAARGPFGHGTACAGIIHRLAPEARITSVRVLGAGLSGQGARCS